MSWEALYPTANYACEISPDERLLLQSALQRPKCCRQLVENSGIPSTLSHPLFDQGSQRRSPLSVRQVNFGRESLDDHALKQKVSGLCQCAFELEVRMQGEFERTRTEGILSCSTMRWLAVNYASNKGVKTDSAAAVNTYYDNMNFELLW